MFKETASLLTPLALSVALHAGGFAFLQAHYGAPPGDRPDAARRPLALRVTTLEAKRASPFNAAAEVSPDAAAAPFQEALPEGTIALPGLYYFPPQDLSRKPQAVAPVPLEYPENAPVVPKNRIVLRLLISAAGDVDKVIVETADVPQELEQLARRAFARAKFQPGLRGDVAVGSQMLVEITFEGEDTPPPPTALLPAR